MACHRPFMAFPKLNIYMHEPPTGTSFYDSKNCCTQWCSLTVLRILLPITLCSFFHSPTVCTAHKTHLCIPRTEHWTSDGPKRPHLTGAWSPPRLFGSFTWNYRLSQAIKFTLFCPGKLFSLKFNYSTANPQSIIQRKRETFPIMKL